MKLPTEAELIELENSIAYWDWWRRDQIQLLIDFARAQLPPIPPMSPRRPAPKLSVIVHPKKKRTPRRKINTHR